MGILGKSLLFPFGASVAKHGRGRTIDDKLGPKGTDVDSCPNDVPTTTVLPFFVASRREGDVNAGSSKLPTGCLMAKETRYSVTSKTIVRSYHRLGGVFADIVGP